MHHGLLSQQVIFHNHFGSVCLEKSSLLYCTSAVFHLDPPFSLLFIVTTTRTNLVIMVLC